MVGHFTKQNNPVHLIVSFIRSATHVIETTLYLFLQCVAPPDQCNNIVYWGPHFAWLRSCAALVDENQHVDQAKVLHNNYKVGMVYCVVWWSSFIVAHLQRRPTLGPHVCRVKSGLVGSKPMSSHGNDGPSNSSPNKKIVVSSMRYS